MTFGITLQAGARPVCPHPLPSNEFANLWHRWDFIEAKYFPDRSHPQWQRVKDFPLEPRPLMRRWSDPEQLVGVSFGKETQYCLVDIDIRSEYHPNCYPSAYRQVLDRLEEIGLIEPLVLTSSNSGGLHLYYPLPEAVSSYKLGHLLKHACEQGELTVKAGQIELFPNAKRYSASSIVLYQAHRLPLQQGSYLLDEDGNAIGNNLNLFMTQWKRAAARQDTDLLKEHLDNLAKVIPFPQQHLSNRAKAFKADDRARIEQGWTGPEQTNDLLGVIARYGRIWEGLADEELARYIAGVAVELPGYREHCGHQGEIAKRSQEWASSSTKHYYPYTERGDRVEKPKQQTNEQKQQAARQRIEQAMRELNELGTLASGITERCQQLSKHGVSKETLYKNKELWHPTHYREEVPRDTTTDHPEITSTPKPQVEQGIEAISGVITDPGQRSLGSSELSSSAPREINSEQTMGGCRGEIDESEVLGTDSQERDIDSLLERVKAAAGDCWSVTLERLIEATNPQRVLKALEAFWEQVKRVRISNAGAWLYRAIAEGYEPNHRVTISAEQAEFNEWFELAREAGLAIASESCADGQIWVYLSDDRKLLWSELIKKYSIQRLATLEPGFYSYLSVACSAQVPGLLDRADTKGPEIHQYSEGNEEDRAVPMPGQIRQWIARQKMQQAQRQLKF